MKKRVLQFEFEKENKNSIRFKEIPDNENATILGDLYVQKEFAEEADKLQITIEIKDEA